MRLLSLLAAGLLAGALQAQDLVDLTRLDGNQNARNAQVYAPGGGTRAASACDDFNRANSTNMGPDWTEVDGDFEVNNNMVHTLVNMSRMIHNSAAAPYAGSSVEFDLDGTSTSLVYAAAVIGYDPVTGEDVFVKVQNQSGLPGYDTYGFYHANNGGGYGVWGGFHAFTSPIPGGHVRVSVDATGDVVTLEIDTDFNGTYDFVDTAPGLISSGLAGLLGTGFGYAGYGPEFSDNWEVNDGCGGGGPTLTVSNLVAGAVATVAVDGATPGGQVRSGFSLYGGGPISTPYGDLLLSPPYRELPVMVADSVGHAQLSSPVPAGTTGIMVWVHAFDIGSLTFTNGFSGAIG